MMWILQNDYADFDHRLNKDDSKTKYFKTSKKSLNYLEKCWNRREITLIMNVSNCEAVLISFSNTDLDYLLNPIEDLMKVFPELTLGQLAEYCLRFK